MDFINKKKRKIKIETEDLNKGFDVYYFKI